MSLFIRCSSKIKSSKCEAHLAGARAVAVAVLLAAGQGRLLQGLDLVLREETGIPAIVAEDPLLAVVAGVGMVLEDLDRYRGLLF